MNGKEVICGGVFRFVRLVKDLAVVDISEGSLASKRPGGDLGVVGGPYRGGTDDPGPVHVQGGEGVIGPVFVPIKRVGVALVRGRSHTAGHDGNERHRRDFGKQSRLFHTM